jgi:hypothetical protein
VDLYPSDFEGALASMDNHAVPHPAEPNLVAFGFNELGMRPMLPGDIRTPRMASVDDGLVAAHSFSRKPESARLRDRDGLRCL